MIKIDVIVKRTNANSNRHEITTALEDLGIFWAQPYDIVLEMAELDGAKVDTSYLPRIQLIYKPPDGRL